MLFTELALPPTGFVSISGVSIYKLFLQGVPINILSISVIILNEHEYILHVIHVTSTHTMLDTESIAMSTVVTSQVV